MFKRTVLLAMLLGLFVTAMGCAVAPNSAILAPVCQTKSPVAVGDTSVSPDKVGTSRAEGILILGFGDATISAAMEEGNITRIHHVDSEELNVLGIYARKTVKVYGE